MKYLSVCSGIEAATQAWHPLGWEPLAFSEIDKFPSAVLAHHYPETRNLGDFTNIYPFDLPGAPDLLVGGTPCQSFSVAGLREGMADERGNLALEYIRLAYRLGVRWIVWENVPGVLSSNKGRDFACFLSGLTGVDVTVPGKVDGKAGWRNSGLVAGDEEHFSVAWRVLEQCPNADGVCSLSDVLETGDVPPRYYLSAKACQGILRRAEKRGKVLPQMLRLALQAAAHCSAGRETSE